MSVSVGVGVFELLLRVGECVESIFELMIPCKSNDEYWFQLDLCAVAGQHAANATNVQRGTHNITGCYSCVLINWTSCWLKFFNMITDKNYILLLGLCIFS